MRDIQGRGSRIRRIAPAVAGLALAACGPGARTATEAIDGYLEAVQSQNIDALYCLSAGATLAPELGAGEERRRDAFAAWARGEYEAYLDGRDRGRVELRSSGVRTVKLFSLGRGSFYTYRPVRRLADDAMAVETELRFGYGQLDLSRFSPGTTLYFSAAPAGRVEAIRVPRGRGERSADVLEAIVLRWTLVRSPAGQGCPERWAVASVEPVEGSEVTRQIVWAF